MYMHGLILSKSICLQQKDTFFFRQYMCSCMLLGRINVKSNDKFIHDTTNVDDAGSDDNSAESVEAFNIAPDIAGLKNCVHSNTDKNLHCITIECCHQLLYYHMD